MIFCARATRGRGLPSLDARSGGLIQAILGKCQRAGLSDPQPKKQTSGSAQFLAPNRLTVHCERLSNSHFIFKGGLVDLDCARRTIYALSKLACLPILEGHPCWSTCGRRTTTFQSSIYLSQEEWPRLPFTARIERARFYCALCEQEGHLAVPLLILRGRAFREHRSSVDVLPSHLSCAFREQEDGQATLPPYSSNSCFFFPILLSVPRQIRTMLSLCLIQISALITREKMKNSCRCSFTTATIGKHPKAASAPPDE